MNTLTTIAALSFLAYCPVLCYLDWKYRDVITHKIWIPLLLINIPLVVVAYIKGVYPLPLILISIIAVILWFFLMRLYILPGADFVWLSLISIFMVLNPFNGQPFMLMFSFYLVGMTAATFWGIFVDNLIRKRVLSIKMENGLPYLIPISCALVLALVVS